MHVKIDGLKGARVLNSRLLFVSHGQGVEEGQSLCRKLGPYTSGLHIVPSANAAQPLLLRLLNTLVDPFQFPVVGVPHHTVLVTSGANWHPCW